MWDLFRGGGGRTWELRLGMALGLLPWYFDGAELRPSLPQPHPTSPSTCRPRILLLSQAPSFFFFSSSAASETL